MATARQVCERSFSTLCEPLAEDDFFMVEKTGLISPET